MRSREILSICSRVSISSPNTSREDLFSATSIAAANCFGVASMGPSRCPGMILSKSHAATHSAHRLTSSRRRGNAKV